MTRPGTRLRYGQKAVVPVRYFNVFEKTYTEGVLGIVVQRVRRAPASKLDGNFDKRSRAVLKRSTAYYAKIVISNERGDDIWPSKPEFEALIDGSAIPDVMVWGDLGSLPGCRSEEAPDPDKFAHKGARWETCDITVSSPARPVRGLRYDGPPYGDEVQLSQDPSPNFNKYYDLGPITWS